MVKYFIFQLKYMNIFKIIFLELSCIIKFYLYNIFSFNNTESKRSCRQEIDTNSKHAIIL